MIYQKLKVYTREKLYLAYVALILTFLASASLVASYRFVYRFLQDLLMGGSLANAGISAVWVAACLILHALIYFLAVLCTHLLAFRLETNLKKAGARHLLAASFSFFDQNPSGKVRKIIDDNTGLTHMSVAHLIPDLAAAFFTPVLGLALSFAIDYRLGILFVLTLLIGAFIAKGMVGEQHFMKEYMAAQERMNAEAVEYVRGMSVIKIFGATIQSLKGFYAAISDYSKKVLQYSMSCRKAYVSFQTFFNSFFMLTIPAAFYFLNRGENPMALLAKLIFYIIFCHIIFVAFMKIMYVSMYQYQANSAIEKIESLFEEMDKKQLTYGSAEQFEDYVIDLDQVSFGYEDKRVIDGLSLHLDAGKTYALVGSSGSGKSTLAKLISGFYPVDGGTVRIGGRPITDYSEGALARNIANVFQHAKLFKTSIYDNVQIGNPDAGREQVMRALSLAQCDEILDKFPDREQTVIGSKGVHLSGGEVQRIAIARAILKDAGIIILDEASAAADPENEYEIQQAFAELMRGKTVIMIAHRLSSIEHVDEILVVENGCVVERGAHDDLMRQDSKYRALQRQYRQANEWKVSA